LPYSSGSETGLEEALRANGFSVTAAEVDGRPAVAGRRSDFRWRWFAVRLHTSLVAADLDPTEATRASLDRFLAAASAWAVEHGPGGRRRLGLQTGTAAIAVAMLPSLTDEARAWASSAHGHRFAALAYPVAVDRSSGEVVQPRRMVVGGVFAGFLRGLVGAVLSPA
jgi:hypothetical protein